ncbi:MAG: 50S ribosomal protein L25 [Chloroflexota bacterium]
MEKAIVKATPRSVTGKQVRALRRAGELPAVIYGNVDEPINISMNSHDASRILNRLSASSLVTIELEGKEFPTLVREKQRHYIKGHLIHVDFQAVSLTEKIRTAIGIVLAGDSPAVKEFDAFLSTGLTEIDVECFPQDLPENIVVDVSGIKQIGDSIHVRDLIISDKLEVMVDKDEMIAIATAQKEEEVEEEPEIELEEVEPEVIEKGKKEEGEDEAE